MRPKQNKAMGTRPEPYWTPGDLAEYLQVTKAWIYRQVRYGDLPCRRLGRLLRFVPSEVMAWADRARVNS